MYRTLVAIIAMLPVCGVLHAGDSTRPGLEGLDYQLSYSVHPVEMELIQALKEPLLAGMDVAAALQCWFDGRLADSRNDTDAALAAWKKGLKQLQQADLEPLPKAEWGPSPDGTLELLHRLRFPECEGTNLFVVRWTVDGLKQYGILMTPANTEAPRKYPLLLYTHGAAYGVPPYALPWLARMAREGYVIIGPAFRGEDLFALQVPVEGLEYTSEGEIENLDGEVDDALSAVAGAFKLPYVRQGDFAIIGHSFGSGAGLLVTARADNVACMVSYDAWLTNPFRFYWDRMRRGANNWLSWADFCNQPVDAQLEGLMRRSIVHHAHQIDCPLLLFIGGGYEGSVFHLSHADLVRELERHNVPHTYDVVPDGGHNFVLYYESEAAQYAFAKHMQFLHTHFPPAPDGAQPAAAAANPDQAQDADE